MNKDCSFCKIIKNEEFSCKLFESEKIVAILDKYPINTGHILILPKVHKDTLVNISNDIFIEMLNLSKKFIRIFVENFIIDGYTIMQNGGEFCDFGHFHLHIIPRYIGDGFEVGDSNLVSCVNEDIVNRIKSKLDFE